MSRSFSLPLSTSFLGAASAALLSLMDSAGAQIQVQVIMTGLNAPRDVAVASEGNIYVVEAGTSVPAQGTSITTDTGSAYFDTTGSISVFSNGSQSRTVGGLPMLYDPMGQEVIGAHGIVVNSTGAIYISIGLASTAAERATGPTDAAGLGRLMRLGSIVAPDLAGFIESDAGGSAASSNPFHLAAYEDGFVVADAADNSVLFVDGAGSISRLASLPNASNGAQFVPTGVAVEPGTNRVFVGGLTGVPFDEGVASVYVLENGSPTPFASGFTNIIDIEFGPDGTLYVLEYDSNGIIIPGNVGGLWAVSADGLTKELLLSDGLEHPAGLAAGPDGTLYITNKSGGDGEGELLAVVVPEPSTSLLGAAAFGMLARRKRRRADVSAA